MGTGTAAGGGRAALAAAAGLTLAAALPAWAGLRWPALFDGLVLDRAAVASGQLWRLWSSHLLHLDLGHAAINLAALAILAALAARMRLLPRLLGTSLLLMPAIAAGLLALAPGLDWYAGLSGLLHGWAAWLLVRRGGAPALGGLLLLLAKLAWETRMPGSAGGLPAVVAAHRIGALAGALLALPAWLRQGSQPSAGDGTTGPGTGRGTAASTDPRRSRRGR